MTPDFLVQASNWAFEVDMLVIVGTLATASWVADQVATSSLADLVATSLAIVQAAASLAIDQAAAANIGLDRIST